MKFSPIPISLKVSSDVSQTLLESTRYNLRSSDVFLPCAFVPLRDERHEGGKRGRRLAPARVIEKRSGEWLTPVIEHADERAARRGGQRALSAKPARPQGQREACVETAQRCPLKSAMVGASPLSGFCGSRA